MIIYSLWQPLYDDNVINLLQFIKQMLSFLEIHVYFQEKKHDNFFLSARFVDADVCVVLCLQCIRDSVIIVEEPSENASKYRVKLCRTAVFVLIVQKRMLIIIYNHHEIKTYMQCSKSSQWYGHLVHRKALNMSQHCVGRHLLGELKNKCSPTKKKLQRNKFSFGQITPRTPACRAVR